MPTEPTRSWLSYRSDEFKENAERWTFAQEHYQGDVVSPHRIKDYLIRRAIGEASEAYQERVDLSDYTPHFAAVVDALAGMLFSVESEANRHYGEHLGDPQESGSLMNRLWKDADGMGNNWLTVFKQGAIDLIVNRVVWFALDTTAEGDPRVQVYSPLEVVNHREKDGRVVEAVVKEEVDRRESLEDRPASQDQFVRYTLEGWQRYREVKADDGGTRAVTVGNGGAYAYEDPSGRAALPIFPVRLPMRRHVGYILARKANAIFNKESERDHLLRVANFPLLNLVGDDKMFEKAVERLKKGMRVLQTDPGIRSSATHGFIAPDSGPANVASDVLERKVEEFYVTAFREYGDAAREKTATEVRQDVSAGVGAFLQMLKAAMDDAENGILWRLEQQQFATDRTRWFQATVERSDNFSPLDINEVIRRVKERYVGSTDTMPVGQEGMVSAIKLVADFDGVEYDEEELEAAVRTRDLEKNLELVLQLPVPARARAAMAAQMLSSLPLDLEEDVEMEDGSTQTLERLLFQEALELAMAEDERRRRQAESFGAL